MSQWQSTDLKVQQALILLCEKCGAKLTASSQTETAQANYSKDLQKSLKESIQATELKTQIRFITSSCQGVCPEGQLMISVAHQEKPLKSFLFKPTLILEQDRLEILRQLGPLFNS